MRFLFDQNVETRLALFLQEIGNDASRAARNYPAGLPVRELLAITVREQRILLINDHEVAELVFNHQLPHGGSTSLRRSNTTPMPERSWLLQTVLPGHRAEPDQFLVVSRRGVRVRRRAPPTGGDTTAQL